MFLKRRDLIAWLLLAVAAVCWVYGQGLVSYYSFGGYITTTVPDVSESSVQTIVEHDPTGETAAETIPASAESYEELIQRLQRGRRMGILISVAALCVLGAELLFLPQREAILGPDGVSLVFSVIGWCRFTGSFNSVYWRMLAVFGVMVSIRELQGWVKSRLRLRWCLLHRIGEKSRSPAAYLAVLALWIAGAGAGIAWMVAQDGIHWFLGASLLAVGAFGAVCLWQYGMELSRFFEKVWLFQDDVPIPVGEGMLREPEAWLSVIQAQHREAVNAAVTSERFKVELISNVSHDLRTPLTAILGYGELLRGEKLSPQGEAQLERLNQKAGYMRELVDSLFELTKVSSGVIAPKTEKIDLVRLLEQTVGFYDDQLSQNSLTVKRSYGLDAMPVITDGGRLHQVFANLLGNAIKYALPGTRIFLEAGEQEDKLVVRLVNTASYEMDFRPEEILQRFARGDKARSIQGSGLGLAIAQTYTESVGGSFEIRIDGDQFNAIVTLPKTERDL